MRWCSGWEGPDGKGLRGQGGCWGAREGVLPVTGRADLAKLSRRLCAEVLLGRRGEAGMKVEASIARATGAMPGWGHVSRWS